MANRTKTPMRFRALAWAPLGLAVSTSCSRTKPAPAQDVAPIASEVPRVAPEAGAPRVSTGDVVHIVAGGNTTCALERDGHVLCWGGDQGIESAGGKVTPARTHPARVGGIEHALQVDVGAKVGCVVTRAGALACWHDVVTSAPVEVPRTARSAGVTDAVEVSVAPAAGAATAPGYDDLCVRRRDGSVDCGKLDDHLSMKVREHVAHADHVMNGGFMQCALTGGSLACWGMFKGPLPELDAALASPPMLPDVLSVAVGSSAALAINHEHGVQYVSGVAPPYDASSMRPPKIKAVAVSRPSGHACAIDDGARVFCWGARRDMQLGDPDETGAVRGVENAVEVVTGAQHTCALEAGGRVLCWGDGAHGQLGDGTTRARGRPAPVPL